jgi:hypothetical protein
MKIGVRGGLGHGWPFPGIKRFGKSVRLRESSQVGVMY